MRLNPSWGIWELVYCPWLMLVQIQMGANSSLPWHLLRRWMVIFSLLRTFGRKLLAHLEVLNTRQHINWQIVLIWSSSDIIGCSCYVFLFFYFYLKYMKPRCMQPQPRVLNSNKIKKKKKKGKKHTENLHCSEVLYEQWGHQACVRKMSYQEYM